MTLRDGMYSPIQAHSTRANKGQDCARAAGGQLVCEFMRPTWRQIPRRQDLALRPLDDQPDDSDAARRGVREVEHRVGDQHARPMRKLCVRMPDLLLRAPTAVVSRGRRMGR